MSSDKYVLRALPGSTCARTIIATLEEVGASYEIVPVDMLKGEHKSPEYLDKYHPFGQIPVLFDGDYRIFESRAAARYIAEKHNATELYPTDLKQRGQVEQWLSVNQSNSAPLTEIVSEVYFGPFFGRTFDTSKIPAMTEKLNTLLSVLDKHLSKSKYLAGDNFTLADLSYLPFTHYVVTKCPGFENSLDGFTHVKKWWDDISSRPSWKKTASKGFENP